MKKPSLDLITQAKSLLAAGQTPVVFENDPDGFVRRFVAGALAKISKDEARGVAILAEWAERGVRNFELEAPVREAFAALPDVVKKDAARLPEVLAEVERWKMHHGQMVTENRFLRSQIKNTLAALDDEDQQAVGGAIAILRAALREKP